MMSPPPFLPTRHVLAVSLSGTAADQPVSTGQLSVSMVNAGYSAVSTANTGGYSQSQATGRPFTRQTSSRPVATESVRMMATWGGERAITHGAAAVASASGMRGELGHSSKRREELAWGPRAPTSADRSFGGGSGGGGGGGPVVNPADLAVCDSRCSGQILLQLVLPLSAPIGLGPARYRGVSLVAVGFARRSAASSVMTNRDIRMARVVWLYACRSSGGPPSRFNVARRCLHAWNATDCCGSEK
jgi:hypothetical protein